MYKAHIWAIWRREAKKKKIMSTKDVKVEIWENIPVPAIV